jgi:hypothetical protein
MVKVIAVVFAAAILTPGLACWQNSARSSIDFNDEAARVERLSTSAGARIIEWHPVVRNPTSLRQEWRNATQMPWSAYINKVIHALEPSYLCRDISGTHTGCARQLPGDLLHLEIAAEPATSDLAVRVSLEMRPD